MSGMSIFWIFLILMALQPMLKQRLLDAARTRLLQKIERQRNSRVIALIHRQETLSFLGFPLFRYINIEDSEQVIRAVHMTDEEVPIDLVLHTPGGLVVASMQIARALARHKGKVTVFVPHYAMSGGTLIALAADEIVMSEHAVLGPVDPQVNQYPAASIVRVLQQKPMAEIDDETLIYADQAEKALVQLRDSVRELLCQRLAPEKCEEVAGILSSGNWTHDFAITCEHARNLGLNVSTDMPSDFLDLFNLYSQPVRQRPGVEYIPTPRRFRPPTPPERQ